MSLAVSDRTHGWACEAIEHLANHSLIPELAPLVRQHLDSEDEYEYWRLGGLLARIQAWPLLCELTDRALRSRDPEIQEAGEFYAREYDFLQGAAQDQPTDGDISSAVSV
ncbi:hypothetical protein ACIHEI_08120 [Kitasatospora sp. NPDC051984]|uniref:hypothetical protein n=1 Tax=Kitasatospora sp. NPDC051984 TaxID=3364059 RepID=UPI0037C9E68D